MSVEHAKSGRERRRHPRLPVRKVGRIILTSPRRVLSCIILDLSHGGARLLVHAPVPDRFDLYYLATRVLREVRVIRRGRDMLAVEFVNDARSVDCETAHNKMLV